MLLSREQVRSVDRVLIDKYGVSGLVLMENAGRGCAELMLRKGAAGRVVICCGKGNNGGDGFVIARQLRIAGVPAEVLLCCRPHELQSDALANFRLLHESRVPVMELAPEQIEGSLESQLSDATWIVDALLGTGARGEMRSPLREVVATLNASSARKLAVDLPSGLDCDTGEPGPVTFQADATCTFVAHKLGFQNPLAAPYLGQIHVCHIGVPDVWVRQILAVS